MSKLESAARRIWRILPKRVVNAPVAVHIKREALTRFRGGDAPPVERVVHTLTELDEMLEMLERASAISDDELRRGFKAFRMELDFRPPDDPYSDQYRDSVLQLYEWLHGKPYSIENEDSVFDVARAVDIPFPYTTRSASTVGDHLIAVGHVIRTLDLPPGSRVLEFGPGWGNTTVALAQMGLDVTAIDISPRFVDLIKARAARVNAHIETLVGDFAMIHEIEGKYDAVLFFECFHHCPNHLDLLSGLDRVVAPGGRVLFAAEPIYKWFPVPWGLRLDGESLWAIRRNGWFELGFRRSYFLQALDRYGWNADRADCSATPWGEILVATRRIDHPQPRRRGAGGLLRSQRPMA